MGTKPRILLEIMVLVTSLNEQKKNKVDYKMSVKYDMVSENDDTLI